MNYPLLDADCPVNFTYPTDNLPEDIESEIERRAQEMACKINTEFIHKLTVHLLAAKDSKLDLCALLYLSGYDMIAMVGAKENTISGIATTLGIRKQTFQEKCVRLAASLNQDYITMNRGHRHQRKRAKGKAARITVSPAVRLVHECQRQIAANRMSKETAERLFNAALN